VQALSHILQAISEGATDVFLQMPTGGGKSVIGHALSKLVGAAPAYYTVDKVALGDQYTRSLPVVHRIAGRRNYPCYLPMDPTQVDRSTAEIAEREAVATAEAAIANGDPDPFLAVRRSPDLTADAAPCSQVRVATADGDRGFPCRFAQIPKEVTEDWRCPDCGSEEILHRCRPAGRWVDIGDHWASVAAHLGPTRVCPYYRDRFIAANSGSVITTNDYYFRYPQFSKRPLAVYDECDRLPNAVLRSYSVDVTTRTVSRLIDVSMTSLMADRDRDDGQPADGQTTLFGSAAPQRPSTFDVPAELGEFDPDHHLESPAAWELDSGRIIGWLRRLLGRVDKLLADDAYPSDVKARVTTTADGIRGFLDTVADATEPNFYWEVGTRDDGVRFIALRPILIGQYARSILESRSRIRLYMSATVGNVELLARELGLDPETTAYVRFDYSDFPVANRPIVAVNGGTMSYKGGQGRQPSDFLAHAKIIHGIATRMYPDRKGLILPFSNRISEGLSDAIRRRYSSVGTRLVSDSSDMGSERYAFIERFRQSTGNKILMSTYTNEGFDPVPTDVDTDRSVHWLVVAKIPYPDLSDMRVRILRTRHPETYGDAWYEAETARTWLQMIGRIHRSAGDTGRIFVLDPAFVWAYKKWRHAGLVPRYIDEAVDLRD
jgi:Rad3-related DNA helicase